MRYYSSLKPAQKDSTINSILILANGLENLDVGLALNILMGAKKYHREKVEELLKVQKVFKYKGTYYPLNFKIIIDALNK